MPVSDPIADMLARIRNALLARHATLEMPSSRTKVAVARLLKEEGFIQDIDVAKKQPQDVLRLWLRYTDQQEPGITGMKRVSRPGLRIHVQRREVPRFYGGLGISVLSTSQGIMTGKEALRRGIGGELMCYVW